MTSKERFLVNKVFKEFDYFNSLFDSAIKESLKENEMLVVLYRKGDNVKSKVLEKKAAIKFFKKKGFAIYFLGEEISHML